MRDCATRKAADACPSSPQTSCIKAASTWAWSCSQSGVEATGSKVAEGHTDSAKSYASKISGVLHDRVVHKKKRVKVNGKFKWVAPTYVKTQKHKNPGTKKTLRVKSGTQIVDRCWRYLKERLNINQHAKVGSRLLRIQLRSAQYEYWLRGQDLWTATGSLVKWFMAKS